MLLVQSCSKSKIQAEEPVPALELYSGYYYKIIKKAIREGDIRDDLSISILSAKYGLLDTDTLVDTYDKRMDDERAAELREEVTKQLTSKINNEGHDFVVINMGQEYQEVIQGFSSNVDAEVTYLSGRLGERGRSLKNLIRNSDDAELATNAA